ncbi:hypothetical protein D3C71_349070 [compost metagenome]
MGKIVRDSHRVGEAGVLLFHQYCNDHKPFIIFREVTKHDFGIDGELEITQKNEQSKIEATGEILKVQIKTVNSANSYMRNEKENSFDFYADSDDLDYWLKHQKFGSTVLLVIVDLRTNSIYVKRITEVEIHLVKKKGGKSSLPISFDKTANKLETGKDDFLNRFSSAFKTRVNFDADEMLMSNALVIKKYPKVMYVHQSKYKTKKGIYEKITDDDAPHFVLKSDRIYTFREITLKDMKLFATEILEQQGADRISFDEIVEDVDLTNIFLELLYAHFQFELRRKLLNFSKDYKRFYFRLNQEQESLEVDTKTRKRNADSKKKVVTYHEYGKDSFYRHLAVELKVKLYENSLWLIINPKYLFTSDKHKPLPPKSITKYTNYLTSREFNNEYANILHFWKDYLFNGHSDWMLNRDEKDAITIGDYETTTVQFGIAMDVKAAKKKDDGEVDSVQTSLF